MLRETRLGCEFDCKCYVISGYLFYGTCQVNCIYPSARMRYRIFSIFGYKRSYILDSGSDLGFLRIITISNKEEGRLLGDAPVVNSKPVYLGGGGTKQSVQTVTFPLASIAVTMGSAGRVICQVTASA